MLCCQIMNLKNNSIVAQSLSENEFIFQIFCRLLCCFLLLNYFLYSKARDWRYFNITFVSEIPKWKVALQKRGISFTAEWNTLTIQICRGRTLNKILKHNKKKKQTRLHFFRWSHNAWFMTIFNAFIIFTMYLPQWPVVDLDLSEDQTPGQQKRAGNAIGEHNHRCSAL